MKEKLNILFLSSWYPSKAISTLGNFVQRHAEAVSSKHHVHVLYVTFLNDLSEKIKIEQTTINQVITTIVYIRKSASSALRKHNAFLKGIEYLKQKGQFHFDLVHLNIIWNAGWQARYLHSKYKIPYIITEHWTGYDKSIRQDQPRLLKPFSKYVVSKASAICPVTKNLAGVMQEYGLKGNYQVVPNVVDTSVFKPFPKEQKPVRFLHVSTLNDEHKNISGLLRAWKKFSDRHTDVFLSIGGDGPYLKYEVLAYQMQIRQDSISFFGEKKWEVIASMMQRSHCLLLFSNYENLPCVVVEALASGMAVISTDVGGIREHIDSERGILVQKGNETELSEALATFSQTYLNSNVGALRKYAEDHFSSESISNAFDKIYRACLK